MAVKQRGDVKTAAKYYEIHRNRDCEVPEFVIEAVRDGLENARGGEDVAITPSDFRDAVAREVAHFMNGPDRQWRFCSCYRHEATPLHSLIYSIVSTVGANYAAAKLAEGKE